MDYTDDQVTYQNFKNEVSSPSELKQSPSEA